MEVGRGTGLPRPDSEADLKNAHNIDFFESVVLLRVLFELFDVTRTKVAKLLTPCID
jgi:hypothetical protein